MLTVIPDKQNDTSESKLLNCRSNGTNAGYVRFHHRGYILVIDELYPLADGGEPIPAETYAVLDTIIRALGSYGLNHSCYYVECSDPMLYSTLSHLRFVRDGSMMKSDLSKLLAHNK